MNIERSTTVEKIFKQYLTIVNGILSPGKKLTDIEIEVLDRMLIIDYKYRHLPKDKRDTILFHKITRQKIRESIFNMSKHSYNNIITHLRKKGMIEGKSLKVSVPIKDNSVELNFKFVLNAEENTTAIRTDS